MDLQLRHRRRTHLTARALSLGVGAALLVAHPLAAATPPSIPWPVDAPLRVADATGALGTNVSGLAPDGATGLWAVRDGPGALLALDRTGTTWTTRAGWGDGRALQYPDGRAGPDAEAVTTVAGDPGAVYVGAERDNADPSRPRNSVLRFDTTGQGALRATKEWRLDALLPLGAANTGIEGLAWIADDALVSVGLRDRSGALYRPADLGPHRGGLFVIGVEQRAELFFVALLDDGSASVIATASTGLASVMDVQWDAEHRELWAICDNTCDGRMAVLHPVDGSFTVAAEVQPPNGARSLNHEGFARLPCRDAQTLVVWSDDAATNRHALRESTLPCTPVVGAELGTTTPSAPATTARPTSTTGTVAPSDATTTESNTSDGSGGVPATALVAGAAVLLGGAAAAAAVTRRRSHG